MIKDRLRILQGLLHKAFPKGSIARDALTLMSGTTIAIIIPIAISPILTRLYTPEDFGVLALYISIATVLSVLVNGRYEMAIMLPEKDEDAINIVALAFIISIVVSVVIFIVMLLFGREIAYMFKNPKILFWLYFLPISSLIMGIYQGLNYWANRKNLYKKLAINKIVKSTGIAGSNLFIGALIKGSTGLVGGQIIGESISTIALANLVSHEDKNIVKLIKYERIKEQAFRYINFPKYLIFSHSLNVISGYLPVFLITPLFGIETVGQFSLTQKALSIPMLVIARALGDVFRQRASADYVKNGNCKSIYLKTLKYLFFISVLPFFILFFIAPDLFTFIFGDTWREAGLYGRMITSMLFLQFVTSPLSFMFMIAEKQKLDIIWQTITLLLSYTAIISGYYIFKSPAYSIGLYSVAYTIMYGVSGIMSFKFACGNKKFLT